MKNENLAPKNKAEFLSMLKSGAIIDFEIDWSQSSEKRLVVVFADGTVLPGLKGQIGYNVHKNGAPMRLRGGQQLDPNGNKIPLTQSPFVPGKFLAFVRVGSGGSSWSTANTPELAAYMAIRVRNRDWANRYEFSGITGVRIYENAPEWYADDCGVYNRETNKPLEYVKTMLCHSNGKAD